MVGGGAQAQLGQPRGVLLAVAPGAGVDDAGLASTAARSSTASRFSASSRQRTTSRSRLGRAKPRTITSGSRIPSRSTMSSRTGGDAVAVSATTRGRPMASMNSPSRR
jgi:hypothetical protein